MAAIAKIKNRCFAKKTYFIIKKISYIIALYQIKNYLTSPVCSAGVSTSLKRSRTNSSSLPFISRYWFGFKSLRPIFIIRILWRSLTTKPKASHILLIWCFFPSVRMMLNSSAPVCLCLAGLGNEVAQVQAKKTFCSEKNPFIFFIHFDGVFFFAVHFRA